MNAAPQDPGPAALPLSLPVPELIPELMPAAGQASATGLPVPTQRPAPGALSPIRLLRAGTSTERRVVIAGWLLASVASVLLGLLSVHWSWSGLPLTFGGVKVYVTVYPPLLICLWMTLALGWWWGAVPAFVATLVLALDAGMPWHWALLFSGADPLAFAVMAVGYRAIPMRRDLRDLPSLMFYVQLSFVSAIFGSSGALIWCYTNGIDRTGLLPIWQGWWLGAFLQAVLVVGPLLAWTWGPAGRWLASRPALQVDPPRDARPAVLRLLGAVTAGVLVYGYVTLRLAGEQLERAVPAAGDRAAAAVEVMRQTTSVFFWVFALIVVFIAFFGYQLFLHWQQSGDRLLAELQRANEALAKLAVTDGLTGLLNRRAAEDRLAEEWQRTLRSGRSGVLLMLDIDHFKEVNDRHGHPAGDEVIRRLAAILRAEKRQVDIASRHGGEEFLLILPQTDAAGAGLLAERLRRRVQDELIAVDGHDIRITISVGLAVSDAGDRQPGDWLVRADRALYRAKQQGRNRVERDEAGAAA